MTIKEKVKLKIIEAVYFVENKNTGIFGVYCDKHWADNIDSECNCDGRNIKINLEDVLMALDLKYTFSIRIDGTKLTMLWFNGINRTGKLEWKLNEPFDEQSDELYKFLDEVL